MSGEQNNELLKEVENLRREIRKLKQQQTYSYFRFKYLSETLRLPELIHGQVIEFIKSGGEYIPNIEKPRSFIEKLQWLYKYYWRDNPRYAIEGKVAGKQYIVDMLGNKFAIDNIGIFTDPSQIQLERIPDKCVVKRDPGGGGRGILIISDKSRFDSESFKRELNRIWNVNVQYIVYDKTRKLIVEEFLSYADTDYKFFVFNGKARLCYVASPIGKITGHSSEKRYTYYQLDYSLDANHSWIKLPLTLDNHPTDDVVCPINLQEMIKVAEILASDFPFLRVDLYSDGRQIKVGELTPFPHAGAGVYRPVEYDYLFGNWLTLP